ncbi:RAC family serine/threonine-protein kinase [Grifola frondosa]|uniref:non-specific serine/threonine protein kinase n=1 Tax=Grifola frondosa TaxID=5627 RepID=A0A1C7LWN9_GRIFR|nr:RAC family serine/threonine-protein kinase [Grifola frondosa]
MLSVLRSAAPQQSSSDSPRVKFSTTLRLGGIRKDDVARPVQPATSAVDIKSHHSFTRRSVDLVARHSVQDNHHREHSSVTDGSFFEPDPSPQLHPNKPTSTASSTMKNSATSQPMLSRRIPFRVDGQDGPWTVSVAETPHDASSYSLYIRTPTHNLTLTRTALEIVELHGKLRDSFPGLRLPTLPIDTSKLPSPPKRKSVFLNTLSRLASPSSNKSTMRQASNRQASNGIPTHISPSSSFATPVASPSREISDPFADIGDDVEASALPTSNSTITGLAAYLTTVANDSTIRQARVWKRFVRVRTDDLQSVRVERAVKRVRSDLAAHVSPSNNADVHRSISQVVLNGNAEKVPSNGMTSAPMPSPAEEHPAAEVKLTVDAAVDEVIKKVAQGEEDTDVAEDTVEDGDDDEQDRAPTPKSPKPASAASGEDSKGPAPIDTSVLVPNGVAHDEEMNVCRSHGARLADFLFHDLTPGRHVLADLANLADRRRLVDFDHRPPRPRKKRSKSTEPGSEKKKSRRKVVIDDFEMMRVLGKGCAGKVLLVRHKPTSDVFALKAITKRHVLAHQELQHTLTEQAVLKRMAAENSDPFVVKLWFSFHDKENLFLVMDFHPGGDLATQLARWGRLGRDRARFYAAEIVEGVEGLHAAGVIYRDLKPENILIGADGHIVLTDFGLSKEFPRRTSAITAPPSPSGFKGEFLDGSPTPTTPHWMKGEKNQDLPNGWTTSGPVDTTSTFCGTAEYLAPEVIQGLPYSYEVDWWSFGTMLYEMLTGITPFWANNHSDMYYRVLQDELQFPEDRTMDQDTKSLIRGLLQRNPALRMKEPRIKKHPYFSMIDWSHVYYKRYIPPYIPPIDPSNASDTQNFDDTFLDMVPVINDENENENTDTDQDRQTDAERTDGEDSVATPSQSRSPSVHQVEVESVDVFDGYSFKGRHSVIMDGEGEDDGDEEGDDEIDEEEEEGSLTGPSLDTLLTEDASEDVSTVDVAEEVVVPEEVSGPKTPEARLAVLPEQPEQIEAYPEESPEAVKELEVTPRTSHEVPTVSEATAAPAAEPSTVPAAEEAKPLVKAVAKPRPVPGRQGRGRREKSGIPALDRDLSDVVDEEAAAEREREDDEWDFVEAGVVEERNGTKGTSLFARGVVDRYKLVVFRKSTPRRSAPRSFSTMSTESDLLGSEQSESPTPAEKQRRGRTPGLNFRKSPKQFLRHKTPPPSSRSSTTAKSLSHSASATLSAASMSSALLTPSLSGGSALPNSPSLKSKESAISVGSPSESSDQSLNGDVNGAGVETSKGASMVGGEGPVDFPVTAVVMVEGSNADGWSASCRAFVQSFFRHIRLDRSPLALGPVVYCFPSSTSTLIAK